MRSLIPLTVLTIALAGCIVGSKPGEVISVDETVRAPICDGANTNVAGDFTVRNAEDMDVIAGCASIDGQLVIEASDLVDLTGLENLTDVEGFLYIAFNPVLENIDALSNLERIRGGIGIVANAVLTSAQLDSVIIVEESIGIVDNPALETIDISALETLENGSLELVRNPALTDLEGFEGLEELQGNLVLLGNDNLEDLTGLGALLTVTGNINLGLEIDALGNPVAAGNGGLESLVGVGQLELFAGNVTVAFNESLATLNGLERFFQIDEVDADLLTFPGSLLVVGNDSLNDFANLDNIDTIAGNVNFGLLFDGDGNPVPAGNAALQSFDGLDELNSIGGIFTVAFGDAFSAFDLPALATIGGNLVVVGNSGLEDFTGLDALTTLSGGLILGELRDSLQNPVAAPNGFDSFSGLDGLLVIGGNLLVVEPGLDNFAGAALTTVTGPFDVHGCDSLVDFTGLEALATVAALNIGFSRDANGTLLPAGNGDLTSLNGLDALTAVGDVRIGFNESLTDVSGLAAIPLTAALQIAGNTSLTTLDGLTVGNTLALLIGVNIDIDGNIVAAPNALDDTLGLQNLGNCGRCFIANEAFSTFTFPLLTNAADLSLANLPGITDLSGLSALVNVGSLEVRTLADLTSLGGLEALAVVQRNLVLEDNAALADVSALATALTEIGGNVFARNNPALAEADVDTLLDNLATTFVGDRVFCGNDGDDCE